MVGNVSTNNGTTTYTKNEIDLLIKGAKYSDGELVYTGST